MIRHLDVVWYFAPAGEEPRRADTLRGLLSMRGGPRSPDAVQLRLLDGFSFYFAVVQGGRFPAHAMGAGRNHGKVLIPESYHRELAEAYRRLGIPSDPFTRTPPTPVFRVGGTYITRKGAFVRLKKREQFAGYLWWGVLLAASDLREVGPLLSWTESGAYHHAGPSDFDLVSEAVL